MTRVTYAAASEPIRVPSETPPRSATPSRPPEVIAARLTTPERVLLFCVTSGTSWRSFGIKPPTVQLAIFHRLVEQGEGQLVVTDLGRAVLDALIERGTG